LVAATVEHVIFYDIERAIKRYRQFSQKRIDKTGFAITIDQWLILKTVLDIPNITQHQIAEIVFKDIASVTRIIELLVQKGYLQRSAHPIDSRRFRLRVTLPGKRTIKKLIPTIESNRATALHGIAARDMEMLQQALTRIIDNCKES